MTETFSAKQVARRVGTDAKTFRKWLRSTASPYNAVGQGKRYEFPVKDLPKIDKAFHRWHDRPKRNGAVPPNPPPTKVMQETADVEMEYSEEEPSESDLDDIEELDLNLDDLED